jgi:predicted PurR-regulated permease PerM
VGITLYAGFRLFRGAQQSLGGESDLLDALARYFELGAVPSDEQGGLWAVVENPDEFVADPGRTAQTIFETSTAVLSAVAGAFILIALAVTLSYYLLANDERLAAGFRELVGGRHTTAYAYAEAVDADMESVWFGNLLFVAVMFVVATATYVATNLLAPAPLSVPMVVVLGFLTGVASLIPIVVGKVVYVPVLGYLGFQAMQADGGHLAFVAGAAVVYFLLLDILPQTFLQPYISGRKLDWLLLLFAYLLGPVLFGWYGFFLMPMLFIAILEAVRIVLPELLHGERLTSTTSMGDDVGADPQEAGAPPPDGEPSGTEGTES